jgi:hypothetical protein
MKMPWASQGIFILVAGTGKSFNDEIEVVYEMPW